MSPLLEGAIEEVKTNRHGKRGVYQKIGLELLESAIKEMKTTHQELGDILEGRNAFGFSECTVLRRLVSSRRYEPDGNTKLPENLAKAYYLLGRVDATGNADCPRKKQEAISAVAAMLWGKDKWKQHLVEVNQVAGAEQEVDNLLSPSSSEVFDRLENRADVGFNGACKDRVRIFIARAIDKMKETDKELAEILRWNVYGEAGGET